MKNDLVAMILAGGQGTRLGILTKNIAKPAVPFGGKYRIIDFALSNCANSGIQNVGVVTQYKPLELNDHIGTGASWGFHEGDGGATILQPYSSSDGEKWFKGTANAIYQNIEYIDSLNPKYVLILSGDHIYKMDYSLMLDDHISHQAALTIAVIPVPMEEASRFGIMNTDKNQRIIEFEEKPAQPKSNLASMGIYIFSWPLLRQYLMLDQAKDRVLEDFGHDVIPRYLENGESVYAYPFHGYWKDVGTIQSLWEANMEFLDPGHPLNESRNTWKVYTSDRISGAQYIGNTAVVTRAMVNDGCYIAGHVYDSIVSQDCSIAKGSYISQSIIMAGVTIGENTVVEYAIIGEGAELADGAKVIGTRDNIAVVGFYDKVGGPKYDGEE